MSSAVPEASASVLRLACASFWPFSGSPLGHLLGLRKRLVRAVTARGVRVAVLHRAQWLVHWIEGPPGAVDMAWQRIQRMPELEAHRLLHRSLGQRVLREPLHIAAVFRNERSDQVAWRIAQVADDVLALGEPVRLGNALAAPGVAPPCGSIVLASAREHDDVDLLRRLVYRHGGDLVYRRFASADPAHFDTGAAYADFPSDCGCSVRMHVLSRRCLRNELVLGELAQVRELVLLLGARRAACLQLAQAAIDLLRARGGSTRVHLLATPPDNVGCVERAFAEAGLDATVVAHTMPTGSAEADYLEATLASAESDLPNGCTFTGRSLAALAA